MSDIYIYVYGGSSNLVAPFYILGCYIPFNNKERVSRVYFKNEDKLINLSKLFNYQNVPYIFDIQEIKAEEIDSLTLNYALKENLRLLLSRLKSKIISLGYLEAEEVNNLKIILVKDDSTLNFNYFNCDKINHLEFNLEVELLLVYKNYFRNKKLEYYNTFWSSLNLLSSQGIATEEHLARLIELKLLPKFYIKTFVIEHLYKYLNINKSAEPPTWFISLLKELRDANFISSNDS